MVNFEELWRCTTISRAIHRMARITPAVAVGLTDHVWSIDAIVGLFEMAWKEPAA